MEIKPTIALISNIGEVWKVPVIHKATLCYIFLSFLRKYEREALLKNYKIKLQDKTIKYYRKNTYFI